MTVQEDKVILFADGAYGIYAPQRFVERLNRDKVTIEGFCPDSWRAVKAGPDHEWYWEAWEDITQNCTFVSNETGAEYYIYQDGDVWLVDKTAEAGVDHELWSEDD